MQYINFQIYKFCSNIISNIPAHDGSTPILMAAKNGHIEIVKMLMNTTDNPNAPNNDGWTPQDIALHENHHEIAELFNPKKYHIQSSGRTKRVKTE